MGSAQPKLHQLRVWQGDLQREARVLLLEKGEEMLGRPEQQMGDAISLLVHALFMLIDIQTCYIV